MIQRQLQSHQWKAFLRHPMFERNLALKIFMFIIFLFLGVELLAMGFFLDTLLLEVGTYTYAIDVFNSLWVYLFVFDFLIKYLFKQNQSMQIASYLALPVKRNRLFNFLLTKEFSNIWNLYFLFLLIPFAFKAITPYWNFGIALLYILFFYSICIGNSLLVNIANNLLKRNGWFFFLPFVIVAAIIGLPFFVDVNYGDYTYRLGEMLLDNNGMVWVAQLLILAVLWWCNLRLMRGQLYVEMQGKKASGAASFSGLSFLDRLGELGEFINLELKMLARSKRLRSQLYAIVFLIVYYFFMIYTAHTMFTESTFMLVFFTMFTIGGLGLIMSQYMFMAESSFFDGLMSRRHNLQNMVKGKYLLYVSYGVIMALFMLIPVFSGKLDLLFLISVFFYTIGFLFFLMFQNAVYNKTYFDLFDSGMFNWKGTSGNMILVTMLGMFIPVVLVQIVSGLFGQTVTYYFMLVVGLGFTLTANRWLDWTYNRFLKRKYKNMEGFRSNA